MIKTDLSKHLLSKSTFMRGLQCHKSLWLYKNKPALREEITQQQEAIFQQGHDVGELAQNLFPGGIDASPETAFDYQKSVALTAELIESGESVIYEAAFQFNGVMCAIDILEKKKGKWYAHEVKSSTGVKEQYVIDSALQYYIITNAGLELADIQIIFINNEYVRHGELEIPNLFKMESIIAQVKDLQPKIESKIGELKAVLKLKVVPDIKIGAQCSSPYPCDFINHCWKGIPENSVFDLRGRGASEVAFELFGKGIVSINKIPDEYPLSEAIRFQVDSFKKVETIIDKKGITAFLSGLVYPLYYLDFETYSTAIPEYDYTWPYEQIPFQFSCHVQNLQGGEIEHFDFLAEAGKDSREEFVKALIKVAGKEGSVIAYNKSFESRIINEMAHVFPKYSKQLLAIDQRLYDLMVPFRKRHYYMPQMLGSYSIKEVLPALVPELSYEHLQIGNGADASTSFYNLRFEKDIVKVNEVRKNLLDYCELDTLAMVRLLDKLHTM